jgi:Uma2 family endonuclease
VWEEDGRYPDVSIELLSDETKNTDKGLKKDLYQNRFRTTEYFWFSPSDLEFAGFRLVGEQYQAIEPTAENQLWSESLELFLGVQNNQLRYFQPNGELVPTPEESVLLAQQRAERLAEQLRSLGIDPNL